MTTLTVITAPVPAEDRPLALRLLADQHDDESRCTTCLLPTDPDDLADLDGCATCVPCMVALLGEDVFGPEHRRDL